MPLICDEKHGEACLSLVRVTNTSLSPYPYHLTPPALVQGVYLIGRGSQSSSNALLGRTLIQPPVPPIKGQLA